MVETKVLDKIEALNNFGEVMDKFLVLRNTTSDIVYSLREQYKNYSDMDRLYIDSCSHYTVNSKVNAHNYVYFFKNKYTGFIKIGETKNLAKRFNDIRSICKNYLGMDDCLTIEGVIDTSFIKPLKVEQFLHKRYNKYRKYGEWFDIPEEDWKNLYENFITDCEFEDMVSNEDINKLSLHGKLHNIMYIGNPLDIEFNNLLYENNPLKDIPIHLMETYVDSITQLSSGFKFYLSYFDKNEPFYRYLCMELSDYFVEEKYDFKQCSFDSVLNYYNTIKN